MKPTFSEFQFTYGLTREMEGPLPGMGMIDLPRIPSQNQEAEIPADMVSAIRNGNALLAPLFIQYKRPEKMIRSNAGQWTELKIVHKMDLSDGYFRFRPYLGNNNQHNKLVELGRQQPLTYYVAPMFYEYDDYLRRAADQTLFDHTAFIQCGHLRPINSEDHYVTYTSRDSKGVLLSEPTTFPVRRGTEGAFPAGAIEDSLTTFDTLQQTFDNLREEIVYGYEDEYWFTPPYQFIEPDRYDAEEPITWIERQGQFFRDTTDTDLLFFTELQE